MLDVTRRGFPGLCDALVATRRGPGTICDAVVMTRRRFWTVVSQRPNGGFALRGQNAIATLTLGAPQGLIRHVDGLLQTSRSGRDADAHGAGG